MSDTCEPLTLKEINLVQTSWTHVQNSGYTTHAIRLMIKLFNNSELKAMFSFSKGLNTVDQIKASGKIRAHGESIFEAVGQVVEYIMDAEFVQKLLQQLGASHAKFNLSDHFFDVVGKALIETLREGLKDLLTKETETAWLKTYDFVANQMKIGIRQAKSKKGRSG